MLRKNLADLLKGLFVNQRRHRRRPSLAWNFVPCCQRLEDRLCLTGPAEVYVLDATDLIDGDNLDWNNNQILVAGSSPVLSGNHGVVATFDAELNVADVIQLPSTGGGDSFVPSVSNGRGIVVDVSLQSFWFELANPDQLHEIEPFGINPQTFITNIAPDGTIFGASDGANVPVRGSIDSPLEPISDTVGVVFDASNNGNHIAVGTFGEQVGANPGAAFYTDERHALPGVSDFTESLATSTADGSLVGGRATNVEFDPDTFEFTSTTFAVYWVDSDGVADSEQSSSDYVFQHILQADGVTPYEGKISSVSSLEDGWIGGQDANGEAFVYNLHTMDAPMTATEWAASMGFSFDSTPTDLEDILVTPDGDVYFLFEGSTILVGLDFESGSGDPTFIGTEGDDREVFRIENPEQDGEYRLLGGNDVVHAFITEDGRNVTFDLGEGSNTLHLHVRAKDVTVTVRDGSGSSRVYLHGRDAERLTLDFRLGLGSDTAHVHLRDSDESQLVFDTGSSSGSEADRDRVHLLIHRSHGVMVDGTFGDGESRLHNHLYRSEQTTQEFAFGDGSNRAHNFISHSDGSSLGLHGGDDRDLFTTFVHHSEHVGVGAELLDGDDRFNAIFIRAAYGTLLVDAGLGADRLSNVALWSPFSTYMLHSGQDDEANRVINTVLWSGSNETVIATGGGRNRITNTHLFSPDSEVTVYTDPAQTRTRIRLLRSPGSTKDIFDFDPPSEHDIAAALEAYFEGL